LKAAYKARGGLIRVKLTVKSEVIEEIRFSGDFFMYPEEALEKLEEKLKGTPAREEEILKVIKDFYKETKVLTPGVKPEDWLETIKRALHAGETG